MSKQLTCWNHASGDYSTQTGNLNSYLSTPEIADRLVVSANTVRTHIKSIYGKLGVHGRSGAVKRASELGLLV